MATSGLSGHGCEMPKMSLALLEPFSLSKVSLVREKRQEMPVGP